MSSVVSKEYIQDDRLSYLKQEGGRWPLKEAIYLVKEKNCHEAFIPYDRAVSL